MTARYGFREDWCLTSPPEAVRDVLVDLHHYPDWWPQVVAVASLGTDDAWVRCRSVLPYTLDLVLTAVSRDLPTLEVSIGGDLDGVARWTIAEAAGGSRMVFEQDVVVRGLLVPASRLLRPVLRWNHARMMAGCRAGLEQRLSASADAGGAQAESSEPAARRRS